MENKNFDVFEIKFDEDFIGPKSSVAAGLAGDLSPAGEEKRKKFKEKNRRDWAKYFVFFN